MAQSRAAKNLLLASYGPGRELSRKGEYTQKIKDSDKKIKDIIARNKPSTDPNSMGVMQRTLDAVKKNGYKGANWLK